MSASANDLVRNAAPTFATTLSAAITGPSDTSLTLSAATGLPTSTGITLVIDATNATGQATPSLKEVVTGVVSGSQIVNLKRGQDGTTAQGHATGASVVMWITANLWNDFQSAFTAQHSQLDGSHHSLTTDTISTTGNVIIGGTLSVNGGSLLPTATILQFAGATAPSGFLICDGSAVSRTTYSNLFSVTSTTYGAGDGSTTFNLPNLLGRVPVGKNSGTFSALGATGGEETHVLSAAEMPVHNHGVNDPGHNHVLNNAVITASSTNTTAANAGYQQITWGNTATTTSGTGISTQNAGSGSAHNNLQPYLVLNYIIKT